MSQDLEDFSDGICSECGTPDLAGSICKICGGNVVKIDEGLEEFEPKDDEDEIYPADALKKENDLDVISLEEAEEEQKNEEF